MREQQQATHRGRDQHRRERDGAPGRHHGAPDRGFGVVAFGDLLAEAADHEQSVVDGDTKADQRDHRLSEVVHRHGQRRQPHDAERARDGQPADDPGQERGDHTAEHEEQQNHHQRHGKYLCPLLVCGDGPGQLVGQRQQPGQLNVDTRVGQVFPDRLVVLQDEVVVVALELDGHERVRLRRVGHVAQ